MTFQTLTILSVPPVTRHPRMCGFTSRADAAPSCAESVKRAGEGEFKSEGSVLASKFRTRPFSSDTYRDCSQYMGTRKHTNRLT